MTEANSFSGILHRKAGYCVPDVQRLFIDVENTLALSNTEQIVDEENDHTWD
jgi:hypothetical protein